MKVVGMQFEIVRKEPLPGKKGEKVLYQAPANGPKFWVEHYSLNGDLPVGKLREDIRIAFAKIIGGEVVWQGDGYIVRATGAPVKWVQQIARFVPKEEREKPHEVGFSFDGKGASFIPEVDEEFEEDSE